jgi:apoptosis-inducing factor 2
MATNTNAQKTSAETALKPSSLIDTTAHSEPNAESSGAPKISPISTVSPISPITLGGQGQHGGSMDAAAMGTGSAAQPQSAPPQPPPVDTTGAPHGEMDDRSPTGLGPEPLNIVILGASFGGLSCAHHFLDHTINQLRKATTAPNYRLIIISPSTHIYWNIGAPRIVVKDGLIKQSDTFIPIEPGFHRHRAHRPEYIQGSCIGMDCSNRTVMIQVESKEAAKRFSVINKRKSRVGPVLPNHLITSPVTAEDVGTTSSKIQILDYHALICCTGTSAHSDLLSLHGPHYSTLGALQGAHAKIAAANSIVVCGGGCSGIETAGQLATFLNFRSHFPFKRPVKNPKKIILLTGAERCLPQHVEKVGKQAEKILKKLGVDVRHGIRVVGVKEDFDLTGQTKVELSDETAINTDVYIACTGVSPNSQYAPESIKDDRGYIATNPATMRVDSAGPRVYSIGDCASYSQNCTLDVYAAVPVVMQNLLNDLLAHELRLASPYGGNQDQIDALVDEVYVQKHVDSQLCPISRFGGVGILMDLVIPSEYN